MTIEDCTYVDGLLTLTYPLLGEQSMDCPDGTCASGSPTTPPTTNSQEACEEDGTPVGECSDTYEGYRCVDGTPPSLQPDPTCTASTSTTINSFTTSTSSGNCDADVTCIPHFVSGCASASSDCMENYCKDGYAYRYECDSNDECVAKKGDQCTTGQCLDPVDADTWSHECVPAA
jgi:hypothetical protein